ncbi:uncharacterized protein TNCV_3828811 [Trichonephila clavipes]|nr:uncharacterized protein TNCV_3828811 [Trichonephila clavipes]
MRPKLTPEKLQQLFSAHLKTAERTCQHFVINFRCFDGWFSNVKIVGYLGRVLENFKTNSLGLQSLSPTNLGRVEEDMASPGRRLSKWCSTGFAQGHLNFFNLENYVEVRAQLLQVISKFEERYSSWETQGSSKNYNRERRDWDVRWRSPDDHRNRSWRDAEVLDRQNDRRDNYRNTYGNRPQMSPGFENRNRIDRDNRGFKSRGGQYQFRNRGPRTENFNPGDRRHGGRLNCLRF